MKKQIYFAGPLFCHAERAFNEQLRCKLVASGFDVYLPQDIENTIKLLDFSKSEIRKTIFTTDRDKVFESEIFLFVLDGRIPDEGACVELGLAYAQRYLENKEKLLIGLHTDRRAAFLHAKLNPMLSVPLDHVVNSVEELLAYLHEKFPTISKASDAAYQNHAAPIKS